MSMKSLLLALTAVLLCPMLPARGQTPPSLPDGHSESGTKPNTVVRFDPKTQQFQTWAIPSGGYIVRKMDVTPDGNPVLATRVNGVALVEVK